MIEVDYLINHKYKNETKEIRQKRRDQAKSMLARTDPSEELSKPERDADQQQMNNGEYECDADEVENNKDNSIDVVNINTNNSSIEINDVCVSNINNDEECKSEDVLIKVEKRTGQSEINKPEGTLVFRAARLLVEKWKEIGSIENLLPMDNKRNTLPMPLENMKRETSAQEGTGKMGTENRRVSLFFRVRTGKSIKQLIYACEDLMKELDVKIHKKYTLPEHVIKTGYVLGPNFKFANLKKYKMLITKLTGIDEEHYELRKERVYENGYPSKCMVVYAVKSKVREVDMNMKATCQKMELTCMSFKGMTGDDRKRYLHVNSL